MSVPSVDWFSIGLPLFLHDSLQLFFFCLYKKDSCLNLRNFRVSYFNQVHNYTPDWLNWIPQKFLQNNKLFDLEIYNVKLEFTGIKDIWGNPIPPYKMEIRLVHTEGNVCKDTRNH